MGKQRGTSSIQSTTRHEKPCGKSGGPPPKAKYHLVTDSAEYCEGKVKGPREGSEREPETLCLQAVGVPYEHDRVLFVERSGELRTLARLRTQGPEP